MDGRLVLIMISAAVAVIVIFWIIRVVTGIIRTKKFYEMKMAEKAKQTEELSMPMENAETIEEINEVENDKD